MVLLPGVRHTRLILKEIRILQKRALRLLCFVDSHDRAIPLFLEANVLAITSAYYEPVSALMYESIIIKRL